MHHTRTIIAPLVGLVALALALSGCQNLFNPTTSSNSTTTSSTSTSSSTTTTTTTPTQALTSLLVASPFVDATTSTTSTTYLRMNSDNTFLEALFNLNQASTSGNTSNGTYPSYGIEGTWSLKNVATTSSGYTAELDVSYSYTSSDLATWSASTTSAAYNVGYVTSGNTLTVNDSSSGSTVATMSRASDNSYLYGTWQVSGGYPSFTFSKLSVSVGNSTKTFDFLGNVMDSTESDSSTAGGKGTAQITDSGTGSYPFVYCPYYTGVTTDGGSTYSAASSSTTPAGPKGDTADFSKTSSTALSVSGLGTLNKQ